ncbi:3-oxoadipate enol-lactonase [Brenneria uluponensis]|uniref:3-oxoadipate enol-lactonase n=1 Tax=Brenneria uluponensis TaxID=3057057 RepID=UPI0028F0B0C0|nr:3-oxoadipate enol-lactonase [Brenneria ulupoensis]
MEIEYRLDGLVNAPLLVLSNSLGTTFDLWQPQMEALTRYFRVLRYNQRGHGKTPLISAPLTLERLGCDVIDLLDAQNIECAHFCGISMGGLTGLWLSRFAPQRLRRLVVANTAARIGNAESWQQRAQQVRLQGLASIASTSPDRWFSDDFQRREPQRVASLVEQLARSSAEGYAACCDALAQADLRAEIPLMTCPMLVIAGEEDAITKVEDGRLLSATAPQARLALLPAAHISNLACPGQFNRLVTAFLSEKV